MPAGTAHHQHGDGVGDISAEQSGEGGHDEGQRDVVVHEPVHDPDLRHGDALGLLQQADDLGEGGVLIFLLHPDLDHAVQVGGAGVHRIPYGHGGGQGFTGEGFLVDVGIAPDHGAIDGQAHARSDNDDVPPF